MSIPRNGSRVLGRFRTRTALVMFETPNGLVLMTRAQLRARVRGELEGLDLVNELIAERRRAAEREDAA